MLDVLARMQDGRLADVEMQMLEHVGLRRRLLAYWSRLYEDQLTHGSEYKQLQPVVGICISAGRWLPGNK